MNIRAGRVRQRGFSLVELMVAMVIGFIVVGAVGYLYLGTRQAFRVQSNLSGIQESARYALNTLAQDIRMAGYFGCAGPSATITNVLNNPSAFDNNFTQPLAGFDASGSTWSPALPATLTAVNPMPGTDVISLRTVAGGGTDVTKQNLPSADLQVASSKGLSIGDIAVVTNCSQAAVFQVTNLNNNGASFNVVHQTGTQIPGNANNSLGTSYTGGQLIKVATKSYYIGSNPAGVPALYEIDSYGTPQELADGVQNMQILYGVDTNNDGSADQYATASNVANWNQVVSARIMLLLVGTEDHITNTQQSLQYNGGTFNAPDHRLYQTISTTVALRNRIP